MSNERRKSDAILMENESVLSVETEGENSEWRAVNNVLYARQAKIISVSSLNCVLCSKKCVCALNSLET